MLTSNKSSANKAKMPWSVKGVSPDSRELAKSAAADHENTMGEWLSHVIRRVGAAEASGRPLTAPSPASSPASSLSARPPARPPAAGGDADILEDAALVAGVHARLERSEVRLLDALYGLEGVVERLAARVARLEDRLDSLNR